MLWLVVVILLMSLWVLLQFRLALLVILECTWGDFFLLSGIKCSTWVAINSGTSGRSFANPAGNLAIASVVEGNKMASR